LQSTGVGDGIALPHVRNPAVLELATPMVCLCFLEAPVEFNALDGKPVNTLFVPLSPDVRIHLHLLSRISFALRHSRVQETRSKARAAATNSSTPPARSTPTPPRPHFPHRGK
jgi:mannitol/fructose-specific phosphotransferase system IIA component (Ntr-type)